MLALVTNDDGIDSPGLQVLAAAAEAAGLEVVVAAPASEYSGSSASLTSVRAGDGLALEERSLPGVSAQRVLAVHAAPAFIVFVGVSGAFGAAPELVLCGVNHGPNTGHAVLHSGTVGAALTAATHGLPAVAISAAAPQPRHWPTVALVAQRVLDWVTAGPGPLGVLNVNVPDVAPDALRGLRPAALAAHGAVQARVIETDGDLVRLTFDLTTLRADDDTTDASLLAQGWATITALRAPCQDTDVDISGLTTPVSPGPPPTQTPNR